MITRLTSRLATVSLIAFLAPRPALGFHTTIISCGPGGINDYICAAIHIMSLLLPIAFVMGIIFFFYGMMKFMMQAGNDKERESGKKAMLWGIIALFIGASVWGFVYLIANVLGLSVGGVLLPR